MIHSREACSFFNICDTDVHILCLLINVISFLWKMTFYFQQLMFDFFQNIFHCILRAFLFFITCLWKILSSCSKSFVNASIFFQEMEDILQFYNSVGDKTSSEDFNISEIPRWCTFFEKMLRCKVYLMYYFQNKTSTLIIGSSAISTILL